MKPAPETIMGLCRALCASKCSSARWVCVANGLEVHGYVQTAVEEKDSSVDDECTFNSDDEY